MDTAQQLAEERNRLSNQLGRLTNQGGDGNRLVVGKGPAWFVVHGGPGDQTLRIEAAASYYLPEGAKIGAADVHELRRSGFSSAAMGRNLHKRVPAGVPSELETAADELLDLLHRVYHRPEAEVLETSVSLGPRDTTSNPRLDKAIRELSAKKTQRMRNRVYSELLSARLLVPIDESGELQRFGDLDGWDVFGCFTDAESLLGWDPRGMTYRLVDGTTLFPALMQTKVGSVLINPQGRLGGELYRNEIEALANAARARTGR